MFIPPKHGNTIGFLTHPHIFGTATSVLKKKLPWLPHHAASNCSQQDLQPEIRSYSGNLTRKWSITIHYLQMNLNLYHPIIHLSSVPRTIVIFHGYIWLPSSPQDKHSPLSNPYSHPYPQVFVPCASFLISRLSRPQSRRRRDWSAACWTSPSSARPAVEDDNPKDPQGTSWWVRWS